MAQLMLLDASEQLKEYEIYYHQMKKMNQKLGNVYIKL